MQPRTFVLAASAFIVGCANPTTPSVTTRAADGITITSAQPPSKTQLTRGMPVTLQYSVSYSLVGAPAGFIAMAITDQNGRNLTGEALKVSVTSGAGVAEFLYPIRIPDNAAVITVYFTLNYGSSFGNSSGHMDYAQYTVQ